MSKAEERAYEVYPKMSRISESHGVIPADNNSHYLGDGNEEKREGFIVGYNQAEKDNELTWEDVKEIYCIALNLRDHVGSSVFGQPFYEEVLKRFKDYKKNKLNNMIILEITLGLLFLLGLALFIYEIIVAPIIPDDDL